MVFGNDRHGNRRVPQPAETDTRLSFGKTFNLGTRRYLRFRHDGDETVTTNLASLNFQEFVEFENSSLATEISL